MGLNNKLYYQTCMIQIYDGHQLLFILQTCIGRIILLNLYYWILWWILIIIYIANLYWKNYIVKPVLLNFMMDTYYYLYCKLVLKEFYDGRKLLIILLNLYDSNYIETCMIEIYDGHK